MIRRCRPHIESGDCGVISEKTARIFATAALFAAAAVDPENHCVDVVVEAAQRARDKNTILNKLWVFDRAVRRDDTALLAGELDDRALATPGTPPRNDLVLVHVTNTGPRLRTLQPKIEIYSEALENAGFDPLPTFLEPERSPLRGDKAFLKRYPLILSVGNRNLYYTHSQHRQVKSLKKLYPEALCELGPQTARKYKIQDGDRVTIETNRGRVIMKARVDERVAEGIILVPHGWGGEANGNLLTDITCREPIMGYPDQKSLQCAIRRA